MNARFVLLAALAVCLLGAKTVPPELLRSDAPALEIETVIRPVSEDEYQLLKRVMPGMYRCNVFVRTEPGSHRGFGPPDIVIGPGETGDSSADFGPFAVSSHVTIGKDLHRANITVTVKRDGRIVNKQTSTISLLPMSAAAAPAH